tara:strand:- start:21 stop:206 length:186 start_codon:yes stop_codon:yes gene_type:complete
MSCSKTYKVTLTVTTKSDPRDIIDFVQRRIKDALPVIGLEYHLVEQRDTNIEHHGGVTDED